MVRVGGEVDAFCTRCELVLAHTVIAMVQARPVKVECNTCHSVHRHRGAPAALPARPAPRAAKEKKVVLSFDDALRAKGSAGVRPYAPAATFGRDDVLNHPTFGLGWVSLVRQDKIEVVFRAGAKTLIHGRAPFKGP
jgi:hypothetical protein